MLLQSSITDIAACLTDTDGEAAADPTALKGVAVAWGPDAVYYLPLTALTPPAAAASASVSPAGITAAEWRQRLATTLGSSTAQKVLSVVSCEQSGSVPLDIALLLDYCYRENTGMAKLRQRSCL